MLALKHQIDFDEFGGSLEVEFFDQLALLGQLKASIFFKEWLHIDYFRDIEFLNIDE